MGLREGFGVWGSGFRFQVGFAFRVCSQGFRVGLRGGGSGS